MIRSVRSVQPTAKSSGNNTTLRYPCLHCARRGGRAAFFFAHTTPPPRGDPLPCSTLPDGQPGRGSGGVGRRGAPVPAAELVPLDQLRLGPTPPTVPPGTNGIPPTTQPHAPRDIVFVRPKQKHGGKVERRARTRGSNPLRRGRGRGKAQSTTRELCRTPPQGGEEAEKCSQPLTTGGGWRPAVWGAWTVPAVKTTASWRPTSSSVSSGADDGRHPPSYLGEGCEMGGECRRAPKADQGVRRRTEYWGGWGYIIYKVRDISIYPIYSGYIRSLRNIGEVCQPPFIGSGGAGARP